MGVNIRKYLLGGETLLVETKTHMRLKSGSAANAVMSVFKVPYRCDERCSSCALRDSQGTCSIGLLGDEDKTLSLHVLPKQVGKPVRITLWVSVSQHLAIKRVGKGSFKMGLLWLACEYAKDLDNKPSPVPRQNPPRPGVSASLSIRPSETLWLLKVFGDSRTVDIARFLADSYIASELDRSEND